MVEIRENVEEFEDNEKIELLSALMDASMTQKDLLQLMQQEAEIQMLAFGRNQELKKRQSFRQQKSPVGRNIQNGNYETEP